MKNFLINATIAVVTALLFAWTFIYLIPKVAAKYGPTREELVQKHRAEAYHQYLVRKGYVN